MAMRYFINNGETISPSMSWDWDGALVSALFYDAGGAPVAPVGEPLIFRSVYDAGDVWLPVWQFQIDEWRFNGPASRIKVDLSGVTGYDSYQIVIWRTDDPMTLIPTGAYGGESAAVMQSLIEIQAKRGRMYEASRRVTALAAAQVLDSILFTDDQPVILKSRLLSFTGDGIIAEIYESPTYTGGAADPYFNLSAVNPVASTVQLLAGPTLVVTAPGVKAFADDYFISGGTGATRGGSLRPTAGDRVLKPNTAYLLRQTMLSAQDIAAYILWYRGPLDAPFVRG